MFKTKTALLAHMYEKLEGVIPDFEIEIKSDIAWDILELKKQKNAVILGHNYMEPALFHSICDYTGDSLELSKIAAEVTENIIVFCGVEFMAETAKILNPNKTVLLPAERAGCSLAESITGKDVRRLKEMYPGVPIIAYINTYADVKAEVDICVTSGNAKKVVESIDSDKIIFLPDEYLAKNIAQETGKEILIPQMLPDRYKKGLLPTFNSGILGWSGKCEVHEKFTTSDIQAVRDQFPDVVVLAHPECSPEVVENSDFSGSTSKMISYAKKNKDKRILLLTECSMGDNIASEVGDGLLRLCSTRCPHMAQITLENVRNSLLKLSKKIELDPDTIKKAKRSIDRMLEY